MRFDAYAATIPGADVYRVSQVLASCLDGVVSRGRPVRRFSATLAIDVGPRMAAWVGLDATSGAVYVEGKGETSPQLVNAIRGHFPGHSAPRIDVCEDYDHPGAFEALQALVRGSKGPRVKGGYVALPDDQEDGRTWAAGKRGGVGYLRLYEAGKHPDRVHLGRPDWTRLELECRPHYARDKVAAASMSPLDVWGMAGWTHRVAQAVTQSPVSRFEPEIRRYSSDKTTRYIALTFRRHLQEMHDQGEDIVRTFKAIWQEEDELRMRTSAGKPS